MKKRLFAFILVLFALALPALGMAEGENMLSGGFEAEEQWHAQAWYAGDAYGSTENQGGVVYISAAGDEGNDIRLCRTISVDESSYYRISCTVKTEGVNGGAGANISIEGSLAASDGVYGSADWQEIELIGKTAKNQTELTVCVRVGGYGALSSGEAWFKDISMERLASYSGAAVDFSMASAGAADKAKEADDPTEGDFPESGRVMLAVLVTALLGAIVYGRFIETKQLTIEAEQRGEGIRLAVILALAFIMRVICSLVLYGHPTDINCFMAWGYHLSEGGLAEFYNSGMFADYPPGYMYVLYITSSIAKLLGLSYGSDAYALITKMPGIMADIISAYVVYRLTKKLAARGCKDASRWGRLPLVLAAAVAINPLYAFLSGGWGQIDQVLALMLLLTIWLFDEKKEILAGVAYGVAIMTKPQALMIGPLLAAAYFCRIHDEKGCRAKQAAKTAAAVMGAVAMLFILAWPFKGNQPPLWFLDKLIGTATSYNYGSVEAFNLMALLGGNWKSADSNLFILTYAQLGTVLMVLCIAASILMYIKGRGKNRGCLALTAGYMIIALFELGHYMHERYVVPALLLILVAFIYYRDRRLFVSFAWLSVAALYNACYALIIVGNQNWRTDYYTALMAAGCIINLAGFVYLSIACFDIVFRGRIRPAFAEKKAEREEITALPKPVDTKLNYNRRDRIFVIAFTVIYGIIALINLGTTVAPENYWTGKSGDTVEITLDDNAGIDDIWVYGGLYTGSVTIADDDGNSIAYDEINGDMFRWKSIGGGLKGKHLTLNVTSGAVWFNEIALLDDERNVIAAYAEGEAQALFDEAATVPENRTYMYGMYFDELYHARTAYEHLHGIKPYENSHPPLGKIFIMLGIAVFGMNAFGWRIAGALFGIGMVPIMYAFAKRLFGKSEYALLAAGLFAFDFMHYTQTRIATIDVYGVFFIILMYYYMYQYYRMNFYSDGLKKTLKPLFLAGLFFGLGAASKWIDIYAGVGLAVLLLLSLIARYKEYAAFRNSEDEALRSAVAPFWKNTIKTLLWCCIFYIAIPVAIYLASYIPYVLSEDHYNLEGIWGVQKFMLSYHGGLKATHPYQSPWWQWPLIIRPMWYYVTYDVSEGYVGTISAMGNPAVWWTCLVISVTVIGRIIRGRVKADNIWTVLLIGLAAEYIPWVLVPRCTFIYHYFASVPFIILISVRALMQKEQLDGRYKCVKWIWLGVAVALFALFYPAITGVVCSRGYIKLLEWLPSWTFLGY